MRLRELCAHTLLLSAASLRHRLWGFWSGWAGILAEAPQHLQRAAWVTEGTVSSGPRASISFPLSPLQDSRAGDRLDHRGPSVQLDPHPASGCSRVTWAQGGWTCQQACLSHSRARRPGCSVLPLFESLQVPWHSESSCGLLGITEGFFFPSLAPLLLAARIQPRGGCAVLLDSTPLPAAGSTALGSPGSTAPQLLISTLCYFSFQPLPTFSFSQYMFYSMFSIVERQLPFRMLMPLGFTVCSSQVTWRTWPSNNTQSCAVGSWVHAAWGATPGKNIHCMQGRGLGEADSWRGKGTGNWCGSCSQRSTRPSQSEKPQQLSG